VFDLVAVGVEDPIAKIDAGGLGTLNDQNLIGANAEVTVGQPTHLHRRERDRLPDAVKHDEIVASALHLGKPQFHRRNYRRS
jgi:hypothetical protein